MGADVVLILPAPKELVIPFIAYVISGKEIVVKSFGVG
jgi:hypothetical protein